MKLEEFDFELSHKAGTDMVVPDALRRYVAGATVAVPDNSKLIWDTHVMLGHRGWKVVLEHLTQRIPWKGMRQEIWKCLTNCEIRNKHNIPKSKVGQKMDPIMTLEPNDMICLDAWGPLPYTVDKYRYCMISIDHFSKIAIAIQIVAVNGQTMCEFMITVIGHLGPYRPVLLDAGRYFAGNAFGDFLNTLGVERHITTGSHTEANGCCEPFVWTFQQSLAKLGADGKNWNTKVEETIRGYNGSWRSLIGCTPCECHIHAKYKNTEFYKRVLQCVVKYREGLVEKDKRVDFQVGD
jgi:Integrase zinc binding domain